VTPPSPNDSPVHSQIPEPSRRAWRLSGNHPLILVFEFLVLLAVFLWGVIWHYQGWQTFRLKNHDMIIYHENADRLLRQASLPALGDLSSYMSWSPPGTTYWIALGKIFTADPRWQEFIPEIFLFLLELIFAWLLIRALLGRNVAAFAVIGIGISRMGFLGLWPIGHAAYVLGAAYFLLLWARDRRAWAFAAAMVWFGFGLLVDLAILPAVFLFPVVWAAYRPPWKTLWPVVGIIFVMLLWFPYLQWESQHGFRDLLSLVNRESVSGQPSPVNGQGSYCNASLLGESGTWSGAYADWGFADQGSRFVVYPGSSPLAKLRYRVCQLGVNLDRNFDANYFAWGAWPAGNSALWMLWMAGVFGLGIAGLRSIFRLGQWFLIWRKRHRNFLFAILGILTGLWILVFAFQNLWLDGLGGMLTGDWPGIAAQAVSFFPALGVSLVLAIWISDFISARASRGIGVLSGAVWISWLCLWMLAEPGVELRFWWFWPLQVICIVIAGKAVGESLFANHAGRGAVLPALACLALMPALFLQVQSARWMAHGYSDLESGQLTVVDFLGSHHSSGQPVSVGYQLLVLDYQPLFARSQDTHHRAGAWFDYLLLSRWNLENRNRSVTGLAVDDQYRIVELPPPCTSDQIPQVSPWPEFQLEKAFSCYVLFRKK
jgi:hypothetical protein